MSIMSEKILFSPVTGIVTKDGAPVKNAVIQRYYRWSGFFEEDETKSNDNGQFFLPVIKRPSSLMDLLPQEQKVYQHISIIHDKQVYIIWKLNKLNYQFNGELDGWAIHLNCNLNNDSIDHISGFHGLASVFNEKFQDEPI